jgi:hypothetical protein
MSWQRLFLCSRLLSNLNFSVRIDVEGAALDLNQRHFHIITTPQKR